MEREDGEVTKKVVVLQKTQCYKDDFYAQVQSDLSMLSTTEDDITCINKTKIKDILTKKVKDIAFDSLMSKSRSHSKVNENLYVDYNCANYFNDRRFSPDIANLLFKHF